jgi:hypothetical protein
MSARTPAAVTKTSREEVQGKKIGQRDDGISRQPTTEALAAEIEDQLSAWGSYRRQLERDTTSVASAWLPVSRGGFVSFCRVGLMTFGAGVPRRAISAWRAWHTMPYRMRAAVLARYACGVRDTAGVADHVSWDERLLQLKNLFGIERQQVFRLLNDARNLVGPQIQADRTRRWGAE